jgi:hypothetical protein
MDCRMSHECGFDFIAFLYFSSFLDNECRASWLLTASRPWLLRVTDLMMHLFHSVALERLPFNETMFGVMDACLLYFQSVTSDAQSGEPFNACAKWLRLRLKHRTYRLRKIAIRIHVMWPP